MEDQRLPHPTPEELVDYIEERLSPAERSRLEAHLAADCHSCRQELEAFSQLLVLMRTDDWQAPPARLQAAVRQMYRRERASQERPAQAKAPAPSFLDWFRALLAPRPRLALALSLALIALVAVFIFTLPGGEAVPTSPAGLVAGNLEIRKAGSDSWQTVDGQGVIAQGDAVRTGEDASTVLVFPDQSMAQLLESTELSVTELSRTADGAQRLVLYQSRGQSRHRVEPFGSPSGRYVVETPSASISVHGTQFIVEVGPENETNVRVAEGEVEVTGMGQTVVLAAGESVTVAHNESPGEVVAVAPASVPTIAPLATLAPAPTATARVVENGQGPELLPTPTLRATPVSTLTIEVIQVDGPAGVTSGTTDGQIVDDGGGSNRPETPPGQEDKTPAPGLTRRPPNDDDGSGGAGGGNGGGSGGDKNKG